MHDHGIRSALRHLAAGTVSFWWFAAKINTNEQNNIKLAWMFYSECSIFSRFTSKITTNRQDIQRSL
jgi:hypothetical protein